MLSVKINTFQEVFYVYRSANSVFYFDTAKVRLFHCGLRILPQDSTYLSHFLTKRSRCQNVKMSKSFLEIDKKYHNINIYYNIYLYYEQKREPETHFDILTK